MQRDEILASLRERIVAFAASRLSREAAEGLAQEVSVVLREKFGQATELSELLPLSFQILRHKMLEARRKSVHRGEYNQAPVEDLPPADQADDPAVTVERAQRLERLVGAVERLSPQCRELFRWKLEGTRFSEIQRLLGLGSINTVYTHDFRCRKELLELMGGSWE
jgi:RNA polymerase sigma-70 factor (ECF subfamily)